jgi:triacylglycerol esterase/lipase EstA (alpha/beta hydrolase family)
VTNKTLSYTINKAGYSDVHRLSYSTKDKIEELVKLVSDEIEKNIKDKNHPIVLIGHSLGGIVVRDISKTKRFNIKLCVMINSPQGGSKVLRTIKDTMPTKAFEMFKHIGGEIVEDLGSDLSKTPPPVPYKTIGSSMPCSRFDGKVYSSNMHLEKEHHHHINNSGHSVILFDPRLHIYILKLLKDTDDKIDNMLLDIDDNSPIFSSSIDKKLKNLTA